MSLLVNEIPHYNKLMPYQEMKCVVCGVTDETKLIRKCPICFKLICEDCAFAFAGRTFCTKGCADYFFFGSGDEDDD